MSRLRSAGLQTGVPNDRSSSLGWQTGSSEGLLALTWIFAAEGSL
jgi:hypothetical protein